MMKSRGDLIKARSWLYGKRKEAKQAGRPHQVDNLSTAIWAVSLALKMYEYQPSGNANELFGILASEVCC